jgi:predicted Ser/Thr protein kinase
VFVEQESGFKRSQISFSELVVEKEIGEGSYGKVYLGKWNHAPVALKFCRKKENIDDLIREVKVMMYEANNQYNTIRYNTIQYNTQHITHKDQQLICCDNDERILILS